MLDETSQELIDALKAETGFESYTQHTGGGVMVAVVDLTIDARGMGRQLWLTRDADDVWLLGFYDFSADAATVEDFGGGEDEGVCVEIHGRSTTQYGPDGVRDGRTTADDPVWLAGQVAGILKRLGITSVSDLQGA